MTNYQFLLRFIKEYDLLKNKYIMGYIHRHNEHFFNSSISVWEVLDFVNNSCGWDGTGERYKFENLHLEIVIFYFKCYKKGLVSCDFKTIKEYVARNIDNNIGAFFHEDNIQVINKLVSFLKEFQAYEDVLAN